MSGEPPTLAVVQREIEPGRPALQEQSHLVGGQYAHGAGRIRMPLTRAGAKSSGPEPQLIATGARAVWRRKRLQNGDRMGDLRRRDPLMGTSMKLRLTLEDRPVDHGKT